MRRPAVIVFAATVCLLLAWPVAAAEFQRALPVDGAGFQAALESIDAGWTIRLRLPGEAGQAAHKSLKADHLVAWGQPAPLAGGQDGGGSIHVHLVDGGVLVAESLETSANGLRARHAVLGTVSVPLEAVSGVLFRPPTDPQRRELACLRLFTAEADRESDRVVLVNGDELSGTILSVDSGGVELEAVVGRVRIEADRLAAVRLNPSLAARPAHTGLRAMVGLGDGSRLMVRQCVLEGGSARLSPVLLEGADGTFQAPAEQIVFLQVFGGRATYLSDLEPAGYRHVPYLSTVWPWRADRNVLGTNLRAGGREYVKGIGMHSAARLTYRLDRPYRRFQAEIAIDDHTVGRGSVTFRVFVDAEQRYASETIRGGTPPVPISVDVTGGRQLSLIVDFGQRADELDHANWLDARLVQ